MSISYINTNEVQNIADEVVKLSTDLETEFNNLFRRLSNVPDVTKEWVGNQSEYYFSSISRDKDLFINFSNKIKNVGNELNKDVEKVNSSIIFNNSDNFIRSD